MSWRAEGATLRGSAVGSGPTVVFLHAGSERRQVWYPVIAELRRHLPVRCVAVDQRGHGESGGRALRVDELGADVGVVVRAEALPTVLVGASLGGMAAIMSLAERGAGELVRGVVLVDVIPEPDPVTCRSFLGCRGLLDRHAEIIEDVLAAGPVLREHLAAAGLPVLLVRGGDSPVRTPITDLPSTLAIEVREVGGAGHLVANDAPVELARCIAPSIDQWLRPDIEPG